MIKSLNNRRGAFTVLEIVAAIALLVLLSSFVIGSLSQWDSFSGKNKTIERALLLAVKSASFLAQESGQELELFFDKRGFFVIEQLESGRIIKRIFLKEKAQKNFEEAEKQKKEFIQETPTSDKIQFVLTKPEIIGRTKMEYPSEDKQRIVFSPDGTCTQFSAIIISEAFEKPLEIKFDNMSATSYEDK